MKFILRSVFWLVAAWVVLAPAQERAEATAMLTAGAQTLGMAANAGCLVPACAIGAMGVGILLAPTDPVFPHPEADPMHDPSADAAPVPRPRPDRMG